MRAAVFGDVGGHGVQFFRALDDLGVDLETGEIPADLIIVQMGDLIHKGAYSEHLVEFVEMVRQRNSDAWKQVLGNHEMQHLGAQMFWNCDCSLELVQTLRRWKIEGFADFAFAARGRVQLTTSAAKAVHGHKQCDTFHDMIFTHAGLTYNLWDILGNHQDADKVADAINALYPKRGDLLCHAGCMLGTDSALAGPFWAHSTREVYATWEHHRMPFLQFHGHTAPYMWEERRWFGTTTQHYRVNMVLDEVARASVYASKTTAPGAFIGVDPGYEVRPPKQDIMSYVLIEDFELL